MLMIMIPTAEAQHFNHSICYVDWFNYATDYFSQTTNVNQIAKQHKLKPEDYALVLISKM